MRRHLLLILLILTVVVSLGAVGCGDSESASRLSPLGPGAASQPDGSDQSSDVPTATEIMAAVATNAEPMTSALGSFDLTIDLDVDESLMGEEGAQFFKDPWKMAASFGFDTAAKAADVALDLTLMGETMNVGIKALDTQAWMGLGGNWYEAPPELMEGFQTAGDEGLDATMAQVQTLMTNLSLDPITWFKNQAPVKAETIDGVTVYHLSGSDPDWAKVVADIVRMMQDPQVMQMMGEAEALEDMPLDVEVPTAEELQQMQSMLEAMIDEFQIDLWVQQDNSRLRKATISARMTPPSEEDMAAVGDLGMSASEFEGLNSIAISGTLNLDPNKTVKVSPPDSPKSSSDLESDLMEDPSLLGPLGTMLMGSMGEFDSF